MGSRDNCMNMKLSIRFVGKNIRKHNPLGYKVLDLKDSYSLA
jgi:hypothetical protein